MAETETITIFKVNAETQEAVKSVNDLRENIKTLKDNLGQLEIGSSEYKDTLEELKVNQTALKNAMYATTASLEDVTKAATGTGQSYNALVAKMAAMKEELRATDVSTESGMAHFKDLAASINTVNDQLKAMDEAQGNFQRNVGNYPGLAKTWSTAFDQLDKGLKSTAKGVGGLKDGFDSLSKNPWMFTIGVLITAFATLADKLRENDEVMTSVQKAGMSLEPVLKLIRAVVEKLAAGIATIIGYASEFVQSNGWIEKIINGVVGVGNAVMQFVIAPFKGVAAAIAVFKEQGVSGLKDAVKAFANEMKNGVSFKANYNAGAAIVAGISSGIKEEKAEVQEAVQEVAKVVKKGMKTAAEEVKDNSKELLKAQAAALKNTKDMLELQLKYVEHNSQAEYDLKKRLIEASKELEIANAKRTIDNKEELEAALATITYKYQKQNEELEIWNIDRGVANERLKMQNRMALLETGSLEYLALSMNLKKFELDNMHKLETESEDEFQARRLKATKEYYDSKAALAKGYLQVLGSSFTSMANLFSNLDALYKQDIEAKRQAGKSNEALEKKAFERSKALQYATAVMQTLAGVASAISGAMQLGPIAGPIVGAINAAAVLASGIAQAIKIKNTQMENGGSAAPSAALSVAAPSVPTNIPQVRNVTNASEEERLNQMAGDQRVYILASDIEASNEQRRVQVAETSF